MKLNWEKMNGLIPAIIQDSESGQVYMLGYMNKEALKKAIDTKYVWFYSRSKKRLWQKGETSGNTLRVINLSADCDGDSILVSVKATGPVCHTGSDSCFDITCKNTFTNLFDVLESRKRIMPKDSYTTSLLIEGVDKICAKVEEESFEVINAAKNETKQRLIEESVDLIYHLFVLCVSKGVSKKDIEGEIIKRA